MAQIDGDNNCDTIRTETAPRSAFRVHDALGNWMVEDVSMKRMICMTTRERDARFIADALNRTTGETT